MNPIAEEMREILDGDELMHYGMPRRSGRYPWGSGDDPGQHGSGDFITRVDELRKRGITYKDEKTGKVYTGDTAIAKSLGLTTTQFRTELSIAKDERRMYNVATAKSLTNDGLSPTDIGKKMGVNESTVRSWLNEKSEARMNQATKTAEFLKKQVDEKEMVDVGKGVPLELNISPEKMKQALYLLEREGYHVYEGRIEQATNPGKFTTQAVLCKPGIEHKEIYQFDRVKTINEYTSHDDGETFDKFVYPKSMDSKRLKIRYADDVGPDGAKGVEKDGIIELRRGVDDLSLGNARYSQVRILVDDTHYLKGMAVYSDNMPDGVDVIFNTNKTKDVPMNKVLKEIKNDPDNPFGSLIKAGGQSYYTDKDGNKQLSLINKRADEGDWDEWANAVPSQFLGKQSLSMAKKQLNLAKADKLAEYDEICSLNNPTIKKHLLEEFANNCDAAAVNLKAAALPGQKYHVIVPINSLKDDEVYAPNYTDGTKLALIRYPHGGTFEIPILTVNNKHAPAKKLLGADVIDAVGITSKVAERLSGADFDGDTVMCIPTHDPAGKVKITSTPPLKGLEGFDPKMAYPERPGMRVMTKKNTQIQMGVVSNLITDMTLAGATQAELAQAVRHSMVVIDAAKHKLDYKQSEIDNNIAALKKKYQIQPDGGTGGAATILSRAKGEQPVLKRQGTPTINIKGKPGYDPSKPEGSLIYKTADDVEYTVSKTNKRTGEVVNETRYRTQKSTKMAETDDANTLVSINKRPMELVYADYANSMKDMANKARVEMVKTGKIQYSASAKAAYQKEVDSLTEKLREAQLNTVRERAAQRKTAYEVKAKLQADPNMDKSDIKKIKQQTLSANRSAMGSISRRKRNIDITDREWDAIQAGAISENVLKQILNNTDVDKLRQRATPRSTTTLSTAKINRIKNLNASNYTLNQIATMLGVSTSTVSKYLKGAN
jgi:predicted transcriptional regulator